MEKNIRNGSKYGEIVKSTDYKKGETNNQNKPEEIK